MSLNVALAVLWSLIGFGLTANGSHVEALLAFVVSTLWFICDAVEKAGRRP